jgi:hypothetical protein
MKQSQRRRIRIALLVALLTPIAVLAAGAGHPPARRPVVPEGIILLLQQDLTAITGAAPDAILYGAARDADLLRQIALATRTSAQAQVELIRQQNEIIRLLEQLARGREAAR